MAESAVVRVAREYRAQIARNEDKALRRMARSWHQMERELEAEYFNIAQQIQDLADSGVPVPIEWIYQQRRYQEMLQQVDKAIAEYDKDAVSVISDYQRENWNLGLESARAQVKMGNPESWIWNEVSRDTAETVAGFAGNGAPLAELLKRDYADLGQRVTDALITGIGLGKGAHAVAKDMRDAMSIDYDRSVRIARTEINRAYRLANAEQYRLSGVVQKVVRLCYPPTACFACLELDGEECPNGICDDHPNGKCTTVAITIGGVMPDWQHGHEWLMEQSVVDQRRIMGDERYELWKKDHIPLRDMVQMKPNPVWGGSPSVDSVRSIKQRFGIGNGDSPL